MTITLKKLIAIFSSLTAVCALAFGSLLVSPAPAYAAQPVQQGTPGPFADGAVIEYACRQLGRLLEGQQDRLNLANDIAAKSETWINDLKSKGKDVSALESALATYQAALEDMDDLSMQLPTYDTRETQRALEGSGIACPPADEKLFGTYLRYLQGTGFIPQPEALLSRP